MMGTALWPSSEDVETYSLAKPWLVGEGPSIPTLDVV